MAASRLDRALVARTALDLLNDVGLDGLTLRGIAKQLDVKAPALYWHFKDKQALLDEMATEIMRRMYADAGDAPVEGTDWRDAVTEAMRGLRSHLLRYRDGAKVYSGTRFTDTTYAAPMEAHMRLLHEAGFTPAAAARAFLTAYSYTIGFVIEEQSLDAATYAGTDAFDLEARAERLAGFPLAAGAGYEVFRHHDEGFEAGLAAVVAGVGMTLLTPGAHRENPTPPPEGGTPAQDAAPEGSTRAPGAPPEARTPAPDATSEDHAPAPETAPEDPRIPPTKAPTEE